MITYPNLNGNSGVNAYECGGDYIKIQFNNMSQYLYTYASAGSFNIEQMKTFAQQGRGLNSFIMKVVKDKYTLRQ